MALAYPARLPLARTPTPLQLMARLGEQLEGPRIWVKRDDLTGFGLSGNKVRKLEFCLADAAEQGCDVLLTCGGVQSNHCRATAVAARQTGFDVHLVLRGKEPEFSDGNHFIDQLLGASISYITPAQYRTRLEQINAEIIAGYESQGRKVYTMPVGATNEVGLWGYIAAAEELAADFAQHKIAPEHIVCATGSGGTQGGLSVGVVAHDIASMVWGIAVCDDAKYFYDQIVGDVDRWAARYNQSIGSGDINIHTLEDYIGPAYAVATEEVFDTIKLVAQTEGILLDPVYTGKAFYGMLEEIKKGRFSGAKDIVFVMTGGFFGSFAQRSEILASAAK